MTIVYFSGTGNSKYVAMRLAEKEGTLLYLADLIQEGRTTIKDDVIGIVSPTYFWGLPFIVAEFLKNAKLEADYLFLCVDLWNHAWFHIDYGKETAAFDSGFLWSPDGRHLYGSV